MLEFRVIKGSFSHWKEWARCFHQTNLQSIWKWVVRSPNDIAKISRFLRCYDFVAKDCGTPANIRYAQRFSEGKHTFGQTVYYECNHGYQIRGNSSISCQSNGRWTVLPECICKYPALNILRIGKGCGMLHRLCYI